MAEAKLNKQANKQTPLQLHLKFFILDKKKSHKLNWHFHLQNTDNQVNLIPKKWKLYKRPKHWGKVISLYPTYNSELNLNVDSCNIQAVVLIILRSQDSESKFS